MDENYALRKWATSGHTEIVHLLLRDHRKDPSALGNDVFCRATGNGDIDVAKLLLKDPRVDPSVCYNYAIRGWLAWGTET